MSAAMKPFKQLTLFVLYGLAAIAIALVVTYGSYLMGRADLKPWHLVHLDEEFTAAKSATVQTLDDYRRLEQRVFAQLKGEVYEKTAPEDHRLVNRFSAGSIADPTAFATDWNRTFELAVNGARGGVLMLHGLSDSPYSLRALGERLNQQRFHIVALRLPGHGTAPSGLVHARWEDFAAATRIGARYLRDRIGPEAPLYIVGYSNGAALAVEYALAVLQGEKLPQVQGLILLSPAIGVSPVAALAVWQSRLSAAPGLEKLAWNSISPEYDPYKYVSFAVNAGDQVYALTQVIDRRLAKLAGSRGVVGMPPILAFQSVADATVSAPAVVSMLFNRLAGAEHQVVAFDVNRHAEVQMLFLPDAAPGVSELLEGPPLPFDLTVVTNAARDTQSAVALRRRPMQTVTAREEIGLRWPSGVFSLSHVALPFAPDDPVYGEHRPEKPASVYLGRLELLGERGLLAVSTSDVIRLRFNPFFSYMERRILDFLKVAAANP